MNLDRPVLCGHTVSVSEGVLVEHLGVRHPRDKENEPPSFASMLVLGALREILVFTRLSYRRPEEGGPSRLARNRVP